MKKSIFIVGLLAILASCSSNKAVVIPRAISSIGTATLEDLNLQRSDYEVINTITAEEMYRLRLLVKKLGISHKRNVSIFDKPLNRKKYQPSSILSKKNN